MSSWISANIGTIITALLLACIVVLIVIKLVQKKRAGKSFCDCGCSGCSSGNCSCCSFSADIKIEKK